MTENTATQCFMLKEISPEDVSLQDILDTIKELREIEVTPENRAKIRHFFYGALAWVSERGLIIGVPAKLLLEVDRSGSLFATHVRDVDLLGKIQLAELPDVAFEALIASCPAGRLLGEFDEEMKNRSAKFRKAMELLYGVTRIPVGM